MSLPVYIQQIWLFFQGMLSYFGTALNLTNLTLSLGLFTGIFATCRSLLKMISLYMISTIVTQEVAYFEELLLFPVSLSATDLALISARVSAMRSFSEYIANNIPVVPLQNYSTLSEGNSLLPSFKGLPEIVMTLTYESAPSNFTFGEVQSYLNQETTAWINLQNAIQEQGFPYTGSQMNALNRIIAISGQILANSETLSFSPVWTAEQLWNWVSFYPYVMGLTSLVSTDTAQPFYQGILVVRYMINGVLNKCASFILTATNQPTTQLQTGTLLYGDSLMDFAARNLGDYTQWTSVISENKLQPPFVTPTNTEQNVAYSGETLYLPVQQQQSSLNTSRKSYITDVLGVDIFYGTEMDLVWTGDLQVVSGYVNLQYALVRRLSTPIGELIYHNIYGSLLPGEIGAVVAVYLSDYLNDYTESSLLGDSRVYAVIKTTVTMIDPQSFNIEATVQPIGSSQPLSIAAGISPV